MIDVSEIVARIQERLGPLEGEPAPLEGGITNRNYRVRMAGVDYVVRLPGKDTELLGIDRGSELQASEQAAALGIGPAVAAHLDDCLVTHFIACRAVSMQELTDGIGELGRALRRFHESPLQLAGRFRISDLLERYGRLVADRGGSRQTDYELAVSATAAIERALPVGEERPCHNDLLAANIIRADDGGTLLLVDWEYAAMGDPRFDLGNLSVNNGLDERTEDRLLSAYDGVPPSDARRAALKAMRVLSDAREGAWGVLQGALSELDFDFAAYATEHFARLRETVEDSAFGEWLSAAEDGAVG
jgi:aminoglycoside phosphotransferase (APT) family kinase protein